VVLPLEAVPDRLWPLPVERLWGVGPRTGERLRAAGLHAIGDLARAPAATLRAVAGEAGAAHLQALARGEDDRPVHPGHEARSISEERTYDRDLTTPDAVDRALLERSEGVARELRRDGLVARTVHLKVRTGDFTTWTRALTLPEPTDLAEEIVEAARRLLAGRISLGTRGVRLLGVGVSGIAPAGGGQARLFPDAARERARRMARAADAVRDRLGEKAITRARLLRRPTHER